MSSSFPFPIVKNVKFKYNFDGWCFAMINERLAEIYFDKKKGKSVIWAHCYVKLNEFNKKEQKEIMADIKKYKFSYRNKKYKRIQLQ